MKKVWKGFAAAVSAAAIAATGFIGATSAYADAVGTGTIELTGTVKDDQYQGYRLLNVTGVNGTSVAYEVNDKYEAVLKTALNLANTATDKDIIDGIKDLGVGDFTGAGGSATNGGDSSTIRPFAAAVMAAINALNADADQDNNIEPDLEKTASGASLAFTDVPRGYYLFNQTINGNPTNSTDSSFIVNSALEGSVSIAVKNGTVSLEKKLQDNDTSNGQTSVNQWIDGADYNIGDNVPFQLKGTLPANLSSFDTFKYVFHDTLSAGLTRNDDLKVFVSNNGAETDVTSSFTLTPGQNGAFTVGIDNLLSLNTETSTLVTKDTIVYVRYTAKLNTSAVIGSDGNPNTAKLEFSNNSDHDGTGDTSETPEDKVTVFTYQIDVEKTFDVGAPNLNDLPKFTLQKKNAGGVYVNYTNEKDLNAEKEVTATKQAYNTYQYTRNWAGLDAGEYKLVETHVPGGYNKADDVVFTITADHEISSNDPQLNTLTGGNKFTGTVSTGSLSTTIQNTSGSQLPSTGGMGTTVLYAAGAVIVLLAGIGLAVTLRRRQA